MEDLELFKTLPNPNLHMTLTPIPEEIRCKIEKVAPPNEARLKVVEAFKKAGIKVRLSVAPMIPGLTDYIIHPLIKAIVNSGADQFYVDPMQPYKQSMTAMEAIDIPNWELIKLVMTNKISYASWKARMRTQWMKGWKENGNKDMIAIWSDHENEVSEDMNTGLPVDPKQEM
jgi:DNA repair photolyase